MLCNQATGVCVPGSPKGCTSSADCAARTDGKTQCDVTSGACVQCLTAADCSTGQVCTNHACATGQTCNNSLDCPSGLVCNTATKLCVACVSDADCGASGRCAANICRPLCKSDKDCTPMGLLCDATAGYCVNCVSDAGCKPAEYCSQGACQPDVCVAGSAHCQNNAVTTCNASGSGTLPPVSCTTTQTCVEANNAASCVDQVCSPLVRGCSTTGERVVQCSADGLTQNTTEDCGANGQVCVAAACKPVVCTAGAKYCAGSELRQCSAKGDSYVAITTCTSTQYCDDTSGSCKSQVCTPNAAACNGTIATTCNANGSGYVTGGTDCAPSQICVSGTCQSLLCSPNTKYCQGNQVLQCSANGLSNSVVQTCTTTQYCDAASVTCKAMVCTPNQPACDANVATTCNATGSGYTGTRTDCSTTNQVCVSGGCQNLLCAPNAKYCKGSEIRQCSSNGLSDTLVQACGNLQYCDAASVTCKDQVCMAGQPTCDQNVATMCATDGSAFTGTRTDCSTTSQYCGAGDCLAPVKNCATLLAAGHTRDGTYTINPNATPIQVYCDMTDGGVTYEQLAFGQFNGTYPGYTLVSLTDLQNPVIEQAFIWSYNQQSGMKNLQPGFTDSNCCFKGTVDTSTYIAINGGYLYPANSTATGASNNCGGPYNDATMRFWISGASVAVPPLRLGFFSTPPSVSAACLTNNNPGFFFKKY